MRIKMSQTKLTSYYPSRKRVATDDLASIKIKLPHIDSSINGLNVKDKIIDIPLKKNVDAPEVTNSTGTGSKDKTAKNNNSIPSVTDSIEEKQTPQQHNSETIFNKKINARNVIKSKTSKVGSATLARKELSLGQIRKCIIKSSEFGELKKTVGQLRKNIEKFKSLDVEVPISPKKNDKGQAEFLSPKKNEVAPIKEVSALMSPRKVVVSPVKTPRKVPAYMKDSSQDTQETLPLPYNYRFFVELFQAMEMVITLLRSRNEKITFTKLKQSVQEILNKNFTEKHLSQIKHLVPDFYSFEIQKCKNFSTSSQKTSYELIITPNYPHGTTAANTDMLKERRRYFYDTLLQIVKKSHAKYLLTLDPPMIINDDKLVRWHPNFDLFKMPDIECAKLPETPDTNTYSTAQDVLAMARGLFKCNTKMERALEKFTQTKAPELIQDEKNAKELLDKSPKTLPSTSCEEFHHPALRNLPKALLEKVKAKQAAKALELMTQSSEYEKKYLIFTRLPDLARTLRNIYVTERKNVLALNIILSKLNNTFKGKASVDQLRNDIKVLSEEIPKWIEIYDVRNNTYVKLNRKTDLNDIINELETSIEKYKQK